MDSHQHPVPQVDDAPACGCQGVGRRTALRLGLATGAAVVLAPVAFAGSAGAAPSPAGTRTETRVLTGHLDPGAADWVYLPVDVPRGVQRLDVSYSYDKPAVPTGVMGNACDIGVFDQRGTALQGAGFRGWSGGFRTAFSISAAEATPGYLAGPVERGRWHVVLGPYQVSPQGLDYTVTVTLTYGPPLAAGQQPYRPQHPPQQVRGTGPGWYRGDCHLHTVHSDGRRSPAEVAAGAREAGLDFIVSTDHNTSSSHGVWGPLAGDDLLVVTGEEITTRNGHYLALALPPGRWVDWRYRARDGRFDDVARRIHRDGGIVVAAHPYCQYVACQWKFGYDDVDAVEVWNGPWTVDDEFAVATWDGMLVESVRRGTRFLPAIGNSDAHNPGQVIGLPQTVVQADRLSAAALTAGLAAGRSWLAESSAVQLELAVDGGGRSATCGDTLRLRPTDRIVVTAVVAGVPDGVVRVVTDEGQVLQQQLDASGAGTVRWLSTASLAAYVRVEVRHPKADGTPGSGTSMGPDLQLGPMAALTNPVFIDLR